MWNVTVPNRLVMSTLLLPLERWQRKWLASQMRLASRQWVALPISWRSGRTRINENLYCPKGNLFCTKSLKTEIHSTLQSGQYSGHNTIIKAQRDNKCKNTIIQKHNWRHRRNNLYKMDNISCWTKLHRCRKRCIGCLDIWSILKIRPTLWLQHLQPKRRDWNRAWRKISPGKANWCRYKGPVNWREHLEDLLEHTKVSMVALQAQMKSATGELTGLLTKTERGGRTRSW